VVEVCSQHLYQQPPTLTSRGVALPAQLEDVVLACLEKDPQRRPQTAAELRQRIEACQVKSWDRDRVRAWWREHPAGAAGADSLPTGEAHTIAVDAVHR
jgi:hypothetical protein